MAAPPLLQLVRNPGSGSHDAKVIDALVIALEARGFCVDLATSSAREPFVPNPKAAHVCVAGGDGTVRHVAAALSALDCPPRFSVYPMGTINLVAREWKAPREPHAFARHVAEESEMRSLAVVGINETHFVACASIGPDSDAVALVSDRLKARIGRFAYVVSLLRVLIRWQPPELSLIIDGQIHACGAVYISKGRFFAGSWVIAPAAKLSLQVMHVTMLTRARRVNCVLFMFAVLLGRVSKLANVKTIEARALSISANRPVTLQLDGDEGVSLPATLIVTERLLLG